MTALLISMPVLYPPDDLSAVVVQYGFRLRVTSVISSTYPAAEIPNATWSTVCFCSSEYSDESTLVVLYFSKPYVNRSIRLAYRISEHDAPKMTPTRVLLFSFAPATIVWPDKSVNPVLPPI